MMKRKMFQFISRSISALLVLSLICACVPSFALAEDGTASILAAADTFSSGSADDPIIIVSLGDSYASGEGNPPFYGQYTGNKFLNDDWVSHRSPESWAAKLHFPGMPDGAITGNYFIRQEQSTVEWYFGAVSGAKTGDITSRQLTPINRSDYQDLSRSVPAQIDIFNTEDSGGKIEGRVDYVTLSLGGNDVGFTEIVKKVSIGCAYMPWSQLESELNKKLADVGTIKNRLIDVYELIHEKAGDQVKIIVTGYPELFDREGCGGLINKKEAELVDNAVLQFNGVIQSAINSVDNRIDIYYVDVAGEFAGHQAYSEAGEWINGIYLKKRSEDLEKGIGSSYSMHPNAAGHNKYAELVNKEIASWEEYGILSGKICKASDRTTPVTNAQIMAYAPICTKYTTPDDNGNYSMELPANRYYVTVKADGYIPFKAYAVVKENQTEYMQTFLMVEGEETDIGSAQGMITNALNGAGLGDVTLDVRKGWNNEDDGEILTTVTTDDYGAYLVTLPIGNYTLCASKEGFTPTMVNIIVQKTNSGNQNGTMTPVLSGDDYRIVLTWGENPSDLDSHVVGTLTSGESFHVYYGHKSQNDGQTEVCNLDVDDTTSYGPETITLRATTSNPYYYYIYRFAGTGTVASSGAQINVYQGERLITTFNVPTNLGSGDYWNVFAIVDGQLVVRNTITSSAETSYANTDVAVFGLRPANQDVHPQYDDRYPVKEDTVDSTNDIPVETEADVPVNGEDEVALQSETKTVYLSLGEVDRNYTWYVETSERVYPVKEETDEIYSVELPAGTDTIFLYGDGDDDTTISSLEISLTDIQDNNCIVALASENEDEFEVMWAYYDP